MKMLLSTLLLLCPAFAAISRVNGDAGACSTASTCASSGVAAIAGNLIAGYAVHSDKTLSSVTDTAGNTYTISNVSNNDVTQIGQVDFFYAKNISGNASNVVTLHLTGGTTLFIGFVLLQYSGLDTTSPLDVLTTAFNTNPWNFAQSTGTFSTSTANEVIIGFIVMDGSRVQTANSGYTLAMGGAGNTSSASGTWGEDQIVTSTQTGITAGYGNGIDRFVISAVSFKAASGGTPSRVIRRSGIY